MSETKTDQDAYLDELREPQHTEFSGEQSFKEPIKQVLREVYDPEIPVNIYELGLIYKVDARKAEDADVHDVYVQMTLTSPGCPVAQEMPVWVRDAVLPIDGIGQVDVEIVWDPTWDPSMMAETAKMELNMFT